MAELDWFFSTLAQSTAAIAGFIITFTAVLYQLERQRREKRTAQLRDDLIELRETYKGVLGSICGTLLHDINFDSVHIPVAGMQLTNEELEAQMKNEFPNRWAISLYGHHLARICIYLSKITASENPLEHYLLSEKDFHYIEESVEWLRENLLFTSDFMEELQSQVVEESDRVTEVQDDEVATIDLFEVKETDNEYDNFNQMWMAENREQHQVNSERSTGRNLVSFNLILGEFQDDFRGISVERHDTLLNYTPEVRDIMVKSGLLLLAGVFLPMVFLLPSIDAGTFAKMGGYHLVAIELFMIVACGALTASLLRSIYESLHYRG